MGTEMVTYGCGHTMDVASRWAKYAREAGSECHVCKNGGITGTTDDIFATDSSDDSRTPAAVTPERRAELDRISAELRQRAADIRAQEDSIW